MEDQSKPSGVRPSKKMSYEELAKQFQNATAIINQQSAQFRELEMRYKQALGKIQEMEFHTTAFRVDTLFKVLDHETHFDPAFVKECADEIQEMLTPQAPSENTDSQEDSNVGE